MRPEVSDQICPVCGHLNYCRIANGGLYKGACWCEQSDIPVHVLRFLSEVQPEPSCLCHLCMTAVVRHAKDLHEPAEILSRVREAIGARPDSVDSYLDEDGRVVFTAEYHIKRGYCCGSGCRHCPYSPVADSIK